MFLMLLILISLLKLQTANTPLFSQIMIYSFFKFVFTSWVADDILNTDSGSSSAWVPKPKRDPFCMSNPLAILETVLSN